MPDAYVMRTCAACKHCKPVDLRGVYTCKNILKCTNPDVPVPIGLAAFDAARWGCVLFESTLPAVEVPPTD